MLCLVLGPAPVPLIIPDCLHDCVELVLHFAVLILAATDPLRPRRILPVHEARVRHFGPYSDPAFIILVEIDIFQSAVLLRIIPAGVDRYVAVLRDSEPLASRERTYNLDNLVLCEPSLRFNNFIAADELPVRPRPELLCHFRCLHNGCIVFVCTANIGKIFDICKPLHIFALNVCCLL